MPIRMWTMDVAREQSPNLDHLRSACRLSLEAGYDSIGLYLEHRFSYPSAPWARGVGALEPGAVAVLQREFPDLRIVPFVNLLGHFEGFLYTEEGKRFREARFEGMQACPSNPEFVELAGRILDDVLAAFDSELVHIGGDETWQLGQCAACASRAESAVREGADGKARLYGDHFGPLAARLVAAGRRPAVWGDMFLEHPSALGAMPASTLIFDWQYFCGLQASAPRFVEQGFEVVGCPTLQTYNAMWMHVPQSEANVRQVRSDVERMGLAGTCVTTWECGLFGSYATVLPAIRACGSLLQGGSESLLDPYGDEREWAELMGIELQSAGGPFAPSQTRSSLKVRLLLQGNPFLAWLHHAEELTGESGRVAIEIADRALRAARSSATRGIAEFVKLAVEFVRHAESSRQAYARREPGAALALLSPCRPLFDQLEKIAAANCANHGGSLADVHRCRAAKAQVERVMQRIRDFGDGSLGYRPSFEHITHPKFIPHDQAAWWLINRWANE